MVYVIARIFAQDGRYAEVRDAMLELAQASRLEPGCMRYDVLEDESRLLFVTREEWRSPEEEQAHMEGLAVAQVFEAVGGALSDSPEISRLSAVSVSQS